MQITYYPTVTLVLFVPGLNRGSLDAEDVIGNQTAQVSAASLADMLRSPQSGLYIKHSLLISLILTSGTMKMNPVYILSFYVSKLAYDVLNFRIIYSKTSLIERSYSS